MQGKDAKSQHAEAGDSHTPDRRPLFVHVYTMMKRRLDLGDCGGPGAVAAKGELPARTWRKTWTGTQGGTQPENKGNHNTEGPGQMGRNNNKNIYILFNPLELAYRFISSHMHTHIHLSKTKTDMPKMRACQHFLLVCPEQDISTSDWYQTRNWAMYKLFYIMHTVGMKVSIQRPFLDTTSKCMQPHLNL